MIAARLRALTYHPIRPAFILNPIADCDSLDEIALRLNDRPRTTLVFETPTSTVRT
jgi:hypothetical protein